MKRNRKRAARGAQKVTHVGQAGNKGVTVNTMLREQNVKRGRGMTSMNLAYDDFTLYIMRANRKYEGASDDKRDEGC
jgi:hypothetical protein